MEGVGQIESEHGLHSFKEIVLKELGLQNQVHQHSQAEHSQYHHQSQVHHQIPLEQELEHTAQEVLQH